MDKVSGLEDHLGGEIKDLSRKVNRLNDQLQK